MAAAILGLDEVNSNVVDKDGSNRDWQGISIVRKPQWKKDKKYFTESILVY